MHKTQDEDSTKWGAQDRGRRQRHCQRGVHKIQDEDNPETLSTWGTQDTGRRQTIQRHCQRGVHKTQDEDKQSRDTVNVGYTRHRTKTNNPETLSTWGTQDTGRRQSRDTVNVGYTRTQDEDNPETLSTWGTQDTGRRQTI